MLDFAADVDTDVLADLIEPFFKRDLVSERFSSLEIANFILAGQPPRVSPCSRPHYEEVSWTCRVNSETI
jgi:hypothetical protein